MPRDRVKWVADVFTESIPGTYYTKEAPNEAGIWFADESPRLPVICPWQVIERTGDFTDEQFGLLLFGLAEWAKQVIERSTNGDLTQDNIEAAQTWTERTYPEIGMLLLRAFHESDGR